MKAILGIVCAMVCVAPAVSGAESADAALLRAVEQRDFSGVQAALAAGANPNARAGKQSVLELLLSGGWHAAQPDMVYALVQAGARPEGAEQVEEWSRAVYEPYFAMKLGTPPTAAQAADMMERAVDSGEPVWVKMALDCGADPNGYCAGTFDPSHEGWTYLYRAIYGGECHYGDSPGTARALMEGGANPNLPNMDGRVPLQCWRCWEEQISVLLDFGADPRLAEKMPQTPNANNELFTRPLFQRAASADFPRLLAAGANPLQRGRDGCTSLMNATTAEAVKLLLEVGVPWGARDAQGHTALWHALQGCHTAAVRALLETAPPAEQAYVRALLQSTFAYVVQNSRESQLVALLLEQGVEPASLSEADLVSVALNGRRETLALLRQHGCEFTSAMAQQLLFRALLYTGTKADIISYAFQQGADANALNPAGQNAAMAALAKSNHPNLAPEHLRLLMAAGLDLAYRDPQGLTLADYVRRALRNRRTPSPHLAIVLAILEAEQKKE